MRLYLGIFNFALYLYKTYVSAYLPFLKIKLYEIIIKFIYFYIITSI